MLGFPIRKSSDHSSVDSSPRLIAASYVLHRLLKPRHPPCALNNLTTKMLASTLQFSNTTPETHNVSGLRRPEACCLRTQQRASEHHNQPPRDHPFHAPEKSRTVLRRPSNSRPSHKPVVPQFLEQARQHHIRMLSRTHPTTVVPGIPAEWMCCSLERR